MNFAPLTRYGLLAVTGEEAREFLHAQLTNDIAALPADRAALAGWCSAKGRLLASFLVVPHGQGFLLQLARDLAPAVAKRLSMFILRSKVKVADVSAQWQQYGLWDGGEPMQVRRDGESIRVGIDAKRSLLLSPAEGLPSGTKVDELRWTLDEIEAGRPLITSATQDLFVPQMVNFDALGGVSFSKGCYPGQEIVARAKYRGQVKRHLKRLQAPAGVALAPGQEFNGGIVVDSAGSELLAVMPD